MKLNDRLTKIEGLQRSAMLPAITLMRIIYEPSETGPREARSLCPHSFKSWLYNPVAGQK